MHGYVLTSIHGGVDLVDRNRFICDAQLLRGAVPSVYNAMHKLLWMACMYVCMYVCMCVFASRAVLFVHDALHKLLWRICMYVCFCVHVPYTAFTTPMCVCNYVCMLGEVLSPKLKKKFSSDHSDCKNDRKISTPTNIQVLIVPGTEIETQDLSGECVWILGPCLAVTMLCINS
jgi:hypothetical protein